MHLQRNTEGRQTQTHTGEGWVRRRGWMGGGIIHLATEQQRPEPDS